MEAVHIAVTRQVKPGREEEFEAALRKFARDSMDQPGMQGVHLIEPVPGTEGHEYGILRSFENEAACEAFYASDLFKNWQEQVTPLSTGSSIVRRLHGLEAFFREPRTVPPPRWKMAAVTWIGVFPMVFLFNLLITPLLAGLPRAVIFAVVTILSVITLTWVVMPLLIRLFSFWLYPHREPEPPPPGSVKC